MTLKILRTLLSTLLLFSSLTPAHGQRPAPQKKNDAKNNDAKQEDAKDEEVLTPLTEEERALDPRAIVAGQPDFVADLSFFFYEGFGGFGGAERVARKGKRYRRESQFWLLIGEEGKSSARLWPDAKLYDDMEPARDDKGGGSNPFNPRTFAEEPGVTFSALGTVVVDGHKCVKIQAVTKETPEQKIYIYAARDLKDLIIVTQVLNPPHALGQRLTNISLDVPDSLVEIPPDYKPVPHDRWTKLETAAVKYKGKPSKDFGVFRAPGGELFVWVDDAPYAWHYLVRPAEGTVETAFQGMLVTRGGKYVWETDEREAFSWTGYRETRPGESKSSRDKLTAVGPNSVKFRSNDYDKDRAIIEVSW